MLEPGQEITAADNQIYSVVARKLSAGRMNKLVAVYEDVEKAGGKKVAIKLVPQALNPGESHRFKSASEFLSALTKALETLRQPSKQKMLPKSQVNDMDRSALMRNGRGQSKLNIQAWNYSQVESDSKRRAAPSVRASTLLIPAAGAASAGTSSSIVNFMRPAPIARASQQSTTPDAGDKDRGENSHGAQSQSSHSSSSRSRVTVGVALFAGAMILLLWGLRGPGQGPATPTSIPDISTPALTPTRETATSVALITPVPPTPFVAPKEYTRASWAFATAQAIAPVWGTQSYDDGLEEDDGKMLIVRYHQKGRMEYVFTDPEPIVTGGRLVAELLSGRIQGNVPEFFAEGPPCRPLFGDEGYEANDVPTYRTFQRFSDSDPNKNPNVAQGDIEGYYKQQKEKNTVVIRLDRFGTPRFHDSRVPSDAANLVPNTDEKGHDIPLAFCNYMMNNIPAPAIKTRWCDTEGAQGLPVGFWDLTGRPISEPYWAYARIDGVSRQVMFQAFERRILTYYEEPPLPQAPPTPTTVALSGSASLKATSSAIAEPRPIPVAGNIPRIDSTNVGTHYYQWRYIDSAHKRWQCPK